MAQQSHTSTYPMAVYLHRSTKADFITVERLVLVSFDESLLVSHRVAVQLQCMPPYNKMKTLSTELQLHAYIAYDAISHSDL
jgi:hypothetical protein